MEATKKYQIVPTEIVGESTYRKSLDGLLTMVVIAIDDIPIYSELEYPVKSQLEVDEIKTTPTWYNDSEEI